MKGTDTKSVLTIELDTQEALSKIAEMRVDLELSAKQNVPKAQVNQDNQRKMHTNPVYTTPVNSANVSVRKATVKVNSVEARITNKASF